MFICNNCIVLYFLFVGILSSHFAKGRRDTCSEFSCDYGATCKPDKSGHLSCVCPNLPCNDGLIHMPLCGSDGFTYSNACELRLHICKTQKWVEVTSLGKCGVQTCKSKWECIHGGDCIRGECVCVRCRPVLERRIYYAGTQEHLNNRGALRRTAVCGTDGVTYESECHLRYHACVGKTSIAMTKRGVCRQERRSVYRSKSALPSTDIIEYQPIPSPRSLVDSRFISNCSLVKFDHCVSKSYYRIKYMGTYKMQPNMNHVYKLIKYGTASTYSYNNSPVRSDIYLHRFSLSRPNSTGGWIVGSDTTSPRGWIGVADAAVVPEEIEDTWRIAKLGKKPLWVLEPSLKIKCAEKRTESIKSVCSDAFTYKGIYEPNRLPVLPITPIYALKVTEVYRRKNKKKKAKRILFVEIETNMKLKRFRSYILKIANEREACGLPRLMGTKSIKKHDVKCDGAVVTNTNIMKKMMKVKIKFLAPPYGCISFSASVLSARGRHYSDDTLVKTTCPSVL